MIKNMRNYFIFSIILLFLLPACSVKHSLEKWDSSAGELLFQETPQTRDNKTGEEKETNNKKFVDWRDLSTEQKKRLMFGWKKMVIIDMGIQREFCTPVEHRSLMRKPASQRIAMNILLSVTPISLIIFLIKITFGSFVF
jgi:hypothetical protein